ncbi:hypothetical protein [Noviherbaspirillum sp.]
MAAIVAAISPVEKAAISGLPLKMAALLLRSLLIPVKNIIM